MFVIYLDRWMDVDVGYAAFVLQPSLFAIYVIETLFVVSLRINSSFYYIFKAYFSYVSLQI
jgi:hypothetical protein